MGKIGNWLTSVAQKIVRRPIENKINSIKSDISKKVPGLVDQLLNAIPNELFEV